MMANGLLDDFGSFIRTPEGQGLLGAVAGYASNARRGTPVNNLGRGGLAGLLAYGGAQDRATKQLEEGQQRQLRDMQLGKARAEITDDQWLRDNAPKYFTQAKPGLNEAGLPPEYQTGSPPMPAQPAKFDMPGFAQARMLQNPDKGFALFKELQKDNTPINVAPGGTLVDPRTNKPVYSAPFAPVAPKEKSLDSKIEQFEYAKKLGYKGTFDQFIAINSNIMAGAVAPLRAAQVGSIEDKNAYELPPPRPVVSGGGGFPVVVGGKTYQFPNQAAANKFKFEAGIK